MLIASNAPDIDILGIAGGGANYLAWHRGPTHGPFGIVGLGVLSAAIVDLARRLQPRRRDEQHDAPLGRLVAVSIVGVLLHVLMDLPTTYGTRILAPFDWHWFAVDWMPIIDVYLLVVLAAGLLFGRLSDDARRRNAAIVLFLVAANYGVRGIAHHRALVLAPRLFGPTLPNPCDSGPARPGVLDRWPRRVPPVGSISAGAPASATSTGATRCLVEIAAIPTFSPFSWLIIAQMSNAYELHDIDLLDRRFGAAPSDSEVFWRRVSRYPNVWTPGVEKAAATRLGQIFLGFSRFPAARSVVDAGGATTVRITDMRFVRSPLPIAPPIRRETLFTAVVRIDQSGQVVSESLGR